VVIRRARRILAGILFGLAAWWLLEPLRRRRRSARVAIGVGAHGERYELRVAPLDRLETRAATEREHDEYARAWGWIP
jgi:hypothetical protein